MSVLVRRASGRAGWLVRRPAVAAAMMIAASCPTRRSASKRCSSCAPSSTGARAARTPGTDKLADLIEKLALARAAGASKQLDKA